jgi:hypothetical protein
MKLVMTLLVRDEADIIASNIDFHLDRGVDFFIVMDNLSVDGSREILRSYEKKGILHYLYQTDDDYSQGRWVTHMARLACSDFAADWVINNDADEFWWPERGDLKQVLNAVQRPYDAISVDRVNFLPRPASEGEYFADTMTLREYRSLNVLGEALPSKVCHRAFADIEVEQGNHAVHRNDNVVVNGKAPITIFHFPMRSYPQFANKIAKGGAAYERNTSLSVEVGGTWRRLYKLWQQGELEAFYQSRVAGGEAVEQRLKDGSLVLDERVKTTLSRLKH